MSTLEDLKKTWNEKQESMPGTATYDPASLEKVIRSRIGKHKNKLMQYFWASFALQVLVYSLLCHVMIRYWRDEGILYLCLIGILLFLPFTIMLMRKFKKIATTKPSRDENASASLYHYVLRQQQLLRSFYRFKKWYELLLIPFSTAIGVIIIFNLYVPGGVSGHWIGAIITFLLSVLSCAAAIRSENKRNFKEPLQQFQNVIDEFSREPETPKNSGVA